MDNVQVCEGEYPHEFEMDLLDLPYQVDHFQKFAIDGIRKGDNVLVCVSTGSGKTTVARYRIALSLKHGHRVIYTSPIKSLSNQKYDEFRRWFGAENVGIMTGDIKFNPEAPCVIMTTEILRNSLMTGGMSDKIDAVIFDEVHYINDRDRGKVWETCIMELPNSVNLVMLSATVSHPERFASWIADSKERPVRLILVNKRQVPLTHYLFNSQEDCLIEYLSSDGVFKAPPKLSKINRDTLSRLLDHCNRKSLFPALVFCFSRRLCEQHARSVDRSLLPLESSEEIQKQFDRLIKQAGDHYLELPETLSLRKVLTKGVAYHHSGLIPILKEIVEKLFATGLIKVLFATETFAVGVNMPTKTVIYLDLVKYDGFTEGMRILEPDEYIQMSGRAGRRGLDTVGTVIYSPTRDQISTGELKSMAKGSVKSITSKFSLDFHYILQTLHDGKDPLRNLSASLLDREHKKIIDSLEVIDHPGDPPMTADVQKWLDLRDRMQNARANQQRKIERQMSGLSQKEIQVYESWWKQWEKYDDYQRHLQHLREEHENECNSIVDYLTRYGYVQEGKLTEKGIAAKDIHECNEILMTEMLWRGVFDDLSTSELAGLLSIFLEERNDSCWNCGKVNDRVERAVEIFNELSRGSFHQFFDGIELCRGMSSVIESWCQPGVTIRDIRTSIDDMYLGNFIKDVIKICHLGETLSRAAEIKQDYLLVRKLEELPCMLMKDVVTVDSLYVAKTE